MTFDERNMMAEVAGLIHNTERSVKKFKTDLEGMFVEGENGRSVYFEPDGSVLDTVTWTAYENDGSEIPKMSGSARMIAGWESPVKKMLVSVFRGKQASSEDLAFALVRSGASMSEALIIATTACDRCLRALSVECGLDLGSRGSKKASVGCDFCRRK